MNTLLRSSDFDVWLSGVADQKAKARILARLASATFGNFGDSETVGEGISEMRIHFGRDIEFITRERERPSTFYWLAA